MRIQTFPNYEHLIIDGYSDDDSIKILTRYQEEDPKRIRIIQKTPRGISNAMNHGIKNAKGQYLLHLHADDWFYDENTLKNAHDFLVENPNLDWVYGQIMVVEENQTPVGVFPKRKIFQLSLGWLIRYINFIPHQAVFIKRSVFTRFGYFDETLASKMDFDLWLKIASKTTWTFLPQLVANFTIRPEAQSSNKANLEQHRRTHRLVQYRYAHLYERPLMVIANWLRDNWNKTYR